ncbi:MAG: 2-dehydropantoate 2-reductase [Dehalococcoidia bacterium]|nr:2-dehydropantoate 2-reductase [Dehalococcoidia bacterium]
MRFIIYGAGAIGGTIGGRLHQSGHDVVLICRGAHLEAIQRNGLLLQTPEGDIRLPVAAVGHPRDIEWRPGDVVILTMKTQDTEPALRDLEAAAGTGVPIICAQNGVENERLAARRFERVYAMLVALPATFLEPGEVIASAAPLSGCLHAGVFPAGTDATITEVCTALAASKFHCEPSADAMALKYRKLLANLGNGLDVITGRMAWGAGGELGELTARLRDEALACYAAAGITAVSQEEYTDRVQRHYRAMEVGGQRRSGSSTLQSVLRGHSTIEVDYLNGEIELLGKLHGVPTPYNSTVRRAATDLAARGVQPGSMTVKELAAQVRR